MMIGAWVETVGTPLTVGVKPPTTSKPPSRINGAQKTKFPGFINLSPRIMVHSVENMEVPVLALP